MASGKLLPSLNLCFPVCVWGPWDQAVFWLGRPKVASLHSASRFSCLPHSTLSPRLRVSALATLPIPPLSAHLLPFLQEFVGVRDMSPVHPRCVQARCPICGSLWPWSCPRDIQLHIPVSGSSSNAGAVMECFSHPNQGTPKAGLCLQHHSAGGLKVRTVFSPRIAPVHDPLLPLRVAACRMFCWPLPVFFSFYC